MMSKAVVCVSIVLAACGASGVSETLGAAEIDTVQLAIDGTVPGDAAASAGARPPHAPPGRHVPAEALAACGGLAAGDACSFSHRERTLEGSCRALPDDAATIVCRPNPPAELLAACADKDEGEVCTFTSRRDGESRTGTCHAPRFEGAPLLCVPERGECNHGGDGGRMGGAHGGRR